MSLRVAISFPLSLGVPGGGTEDCLNLARHMRRAGAELVILCALSSGPGRFPRRSPSRGAFEGVRAELEAEGIEAIAVPAHPLHYLLDGLPMRRAVDELLARRPIDALLGWWHEAAFLPGLLERRGVLFAVNAAASYALAFPRRGRWHRPLEALRERFLVRQPLRRASVVFARSAFTRRELGGFAALPLERIQLVPCGVDERFGRVEPRSHGGPPRILYFGRLLPEKGIFDLLEALGRLDASGQGDWRLRVAGWGHLETVAERARARGILERTDFLGPLARASLLDELAHTDLVCLPSYSESFGLANAEAQAAGVAVVAYAAGAVPEVVVDGETGWLVEPADVGALARALGTALADPPERRRRGAAGRRRVLERFTWQGAALETLNGLREALERRATRPAGRRAPVAGSTSEGF